MHLLKPLCVHELLEIALLQEDFQMITLTEIMCVDDVSFAEMLNWIRIKENSDEMSESDRASLS